MKRPTAEQLRLLALDALEEAAAEAELGPVRRRWALRPALAYLASLHPRLAYQGDPYREFWRALSADHSATRQSALETALRIIYVKTDSRRDEERAAAVREHAHALDLERRR